eukprot:Tamp_08937.p1 GENE.Tamp_08937~~Tamp_08937.p1  ORF type:complete len:425 (+),score=67.86 Tamp_08937:435-1709(+)
MTQDLLQPWHTRFLHSQINTFFPVCAWVGGALLFGFLPPASLPPFPPPAFPIIRTTRSARTQAHSKKFLFSFNIHPRCVHEPHDPRVPCFLFFFISPPFFCHRYQFAGGQGRNGKAIPPLEKRLPLIDHFDLRLPSCAASEGGISMASKRDYLRVYYSDFLSQPPLAKDLQVPYVDGTEREIEGARLLEWLDSVEPRARTETYPLYLLTKEILYRLTREECAIIDSSVRSLTQELEATRRELEQTQHNAERTRSALLLEVSRLNEALDQERAAETDLAHQQHSLQDTLEKQQQAMAGARARMVLEAGRRNVEHKHADSAKKDAHLEHRAQIEKQAKLRKAEAEIEHLKHELQEGDALLSAAEKLEHLRKFLLDEEVFKMRDFADVVVSALLTPPPCWLCISSKGARAPHHAGACGQTPHAPARV